MTPSRAVVFAKVRPIVMRSVSRTRGSQTLNTILGVHTVEGLLIDPCVNKGSMWRGLAYRPLRCDIDPSLPSLDVVASWCDLPRFVGAGRAVTIVADPLFVSHVGKNSTLRRYATELNEFRAVDVLDQVAQLFESARTMLDPVRGSLVLKIGDQVHANARQFQWFKILKLAELQGWLLCDEYVEEGAHMPDPKRQHRYHLDSQVRWLVLHTGSVCPGPGLTLPGRARCAWCGRVVCCQRVHRSNYCRRPRTCRQLAYSQRLGALRTARKG
jgi:hypothetical protein